MAAVAEPCVHTPTSPAGPRRVLVVDRHQDAADSLTELLRIHGHDARPVYCAAEAFATLPKFAPDVVFLALGLRDMDGLDVARWLGAELYGPRPRLLVALTGYGRAEDQAAAKAAGFDHFLLKPADPGAILALLG